MRRFFTLGFFLLLAIPTGVAINGCYRNPAGNYCNGLGYGPKLGDVTAIVLQPQTVGLSLAFGNEQQLLSPTATTCKGQTASVKSYQFGTSNNQLVDISPSGNMCGGTWNRNSGGGIPDYTICYPPNPWPNNNGSPYGIVHITASAGGVTSNAISVYVHPKITSVALYGPPECLSQGQTSQLDGQACYSNGTTQYELCAPSAVQPANYSCPLPPGLGSVPSCGGVIGSFNYQSGNSSIFTIDQYGVVTSVQPGTAAVTASNSGTGASAGFVSTCPPRSIQLLYNGQTSGIITQGVQQNLTATAEDINGNPILNMALNYQSTNPVDVSVGNTGAVTANFPGSAAAYAICQPSNCNPAPINEVGVQGTGLSIASNAVNITVPGTVSTYAWFGSPNQSQYFSPVELLTGTVGQAVRLPYMPNSMVMDAFGNNLYFGSLNELMIYTASSNSLYQENIAVPGVVLAVSPDNTQLLINDQQRQVFYLYRISGGSVLSLGGMGVAATFSPDSRTLYVVDEASAGPNHSDMLYTYTFAYGWNATPLNASGGAQNIAITVPGVGAYLAGPLTTAHTWCVAGTVGNYSGSTYYPEGDSVYDTANNPVATDVLAATSDGQHIVGANYLSPTTAELSDIGVNVLGGNTATPGSNVPNFPDECPGVAEGDIAVGGNMPALLLTHTLNQVQLTFTSNAASLNQAVASKTPSTTTDQNLIFITYNPPSSGATTGASLPYYLTSPAGPGVLGTTGSVTLTGASNITAPIAGAFSPDNTLFFVSTAGDDLVHYINVNNVITGATPQDQQTINPGLQDPNGNPVPATVIVVKPRAIT